MMFYKKTVNIINKTLNKIRSTYLKYESDLDIEHSVLIQEKVNGQEYGLDIINDLSGNYINTIVKKKYAMRAGETDCAVTINDIEMKELGNNLSKFLKHNANLDVDIFKTEDKLYVLEMNARFGGGYPFSHAAGVNLPKAIINWLTNKVVDYSNFQENIGITAHKDIDITII